MENCNCSLHSPESLKSTGIWNINKQWLNSESKTKQFCKKVTCYRSDEENGKKINQKQNIAVQKELRNIKAENE